MLLVSMLPLLIELLLLHSTVDPLLIELMLSL